MEYLLIVNTRTKRPGIPVFLNARLHERWMDRGADAPMPYDWVCRIDTLPERGAPLSFPDELWLIGKDRKYDFDLFLAHAGILASRRLLDLLDADEKENFRIAKVHAVDKRQANISAKALFYLKFAKVLSAVDRNRTRFVQARIGDRPIRERDGAPAIGLVRELHLDKAKLAGLNLFESHDLNGNHTFVSEALRDRMVAAKMRGVDFIPIEDYFEAERGKVAGIEREYGRPLDRIADAGPAR